jgi:RHS repeat-associated protein
MQGRSFSSAAYRFGFNGKEKEAEGTADNYDFGARIYDGRLGRWLAVDNFKHIYPSFSPYNFALNDVIRLLDENGQFVKDKEGNIVFVSNANGTSAKKTVSVSQPGSRVNLENETKKSNQIKGLQVVERVDVEVFTELRYEAVEGYVFDDAGSKVPALFVENSKVTMVKVTKTWNESRLEYDISEETVNDEETIKFCANLSATTNCTGNSFLDGKLVMFSNYITEKVKKDENLKKLSPSEEPAEGDIGVYNGTDGPEHFVTYVSPTAVESKGGVRGSAEVFPAKSPEIWSNTSAVYEVWRKIGEDRAIDVHALGTCDTPGVHFLTKKEGRKASKEIKKQIKEEKKLSKKK